jgi:hypothetical protein
MDHSECVPADPYTRIDVHHTHEGVVGYWLFPSEMPEGYSWKPGQPYPDPRD